MRATIKQFKNLIMLVAGILFVFMIFMNTYIIPTGYTGVLVRFGQIDERPVQNGGFHFKTPFIESIYRVNNKQQDFHVNASKIWGETNDKTPVYANDITVTYQIAANRSTWIYANVSDYTNSLITEALVASAVKSAMIELSPADVTNRTKIEPLILTRLSASLNEKYGADTVYICKVIVGDMDFEEAYNKAIQAKSIAAQEQARAEILNQTMVAKAEADKKAAILKAESDAEKIRIAAEAQAKANALISESISKELIELRKIEAWDGKLPNVMGTGSGTLFGIDVKD